MTQFPPTEPEITVRDRPGETMTVECRDARSFFVLLEEGACCEFAFYDYPQRCLTGISRMRVEGRLLINGRECFEIADYHWEPGQGQEAILPNHWYLALEGGQLNWVRFVRREKGRIGRSEEIEATPIPTRLFVGLKAAGQETYICGNERRSDFIRSEVTGVVEVTIAGHRYRGLREVWTGLAEDGRPLTLAELFIGEQGRTVLFRRYNGRGHSNYELLKGNPESSHLGETYRLWYDCLPDHAVEGVPPQPGGEIHLC